ncbi:MAG: S41 family peptidase [Verrucomicrobiales bacterium]
MLIGLSSAQDDAPPSEEPAPPNDGRPADALEQGQLQEAFRLLQSRYIRKSELDFLQINRAALEGLLARLGSGAELVTKNGGEAEAKAYSLFSEVLGGGIAYLRPGAWTVDEAGEAAAAVDSFAEGGAKTLVLDLRAPDPNPGNFGAAAQLLQLFCPANQLLFKVVSPNEERPQLFISNREPRWKGEVILLIDRETAGNGEIAAAALRHYLGCMAVGETSAGRAVQYQEVALTPEVSLRFAIAEAVPPDGEALFQKGIAPELAARVDPGEKHKVFALCEAEGASLKTYVIDSERPHLNEAALVAGTNPELPFYIARSAGEALPFDKAPLQDRVIQSALDFLTARNFLKIEKNAAGSEANGKGEAEEDSPADAGEPTEEGDGDKTEPDGEPKPEEKKGGLKKL